MNKAQIPATAPPRTRTAARTIPGQRRRGGVVERDRRALRHRRTDLDEILGPLEGRGGRSWRRAIQERERNRIGTGQQGRYPEQFLGQGRGAQPFGRIGGDGPLQHRLQRAEYGQRLRGRFAAFGGHDPDTGDGLTEHQRQVIDILGLLGRRVAPRNRSLLGRRVAPRSRSLLFRAACRLSGGRNKSGGQPEVGDVGTGGGVEEDAGGHEAQVGPAGGVDVHQGPGPLQANHERLRRREAVPGAKERGQASSGEILGDAVGLRV